MIISSSLIMIMMFMTAEPTMYAVPVAHAVAAEMPLVCNEADKLS